MPADLPILAFDSIAAIEAHLARAGDGDAGFRLKVAKPGAPAPTITKADAIEAALCFGWIDGQLGKLDDHYFLIRMTPRRPGSRWSAINCRTVERLVDAGRMRPAGSAQVERAKADGRWDAAYASQRNAEVPPDLAAALERNRDAQRMFGTLDSANRYAIIYRVNDVKRAETRARKIAEYVEMLARGETIHPPKTRRVTT